jgi:class 3 adenylate cyclase
VRSAGLRREVRTMLFADMVGFSRLAEEDTPAFMAHFVGAIAAIVAHSPRQPLFVNTWGDGLYMVFAEVVDGAEFALDLRDAVRATDWPRHGLPAGTGIRIGMHTGPVFRAPDPLIGRDNYFGSHVVRAARIEPIVAPGAVYVSAMMAYALEASGAGSLRADFRGTLPLAKGYGTDVLYRLRRAIEAE